MFETRNKPKAYTDHGRERTHLCLHAYYRTDRKLDWSEGHLWSSNIKISRRSAFDAYICTHRRLYNSIIRCNERVKEMQRHLSNVLLDHGTEFNRIWIYLSLSLYLNAKFKFLY